MGEMARLPVADELLAELGVKNCDTVYSQTHGGWAAHHLPKTDAEAEK